MRIFARKSLKFFNPADRNESVSVKPLDFAEIPDWAANDLMFKWALKSGDIEIAKKETVIPAAKKPKNGKKPKGIINETVEDESEESTNEAVEDEQKSEE